jgi:hypothetical protein
MFAYQNFDVEIVRDLDASQLTWPEPGDATDDSGLGCNRLYADLRGLSWAEAKRVFALEGRLITRIEISKDVDAEYDAIEEELCEEDEHLFGLDLGVASTVVCLSAARCVPFASCNAGVFGGHHQESYPLVAFFARSQIVDFLLASAVDAEVGLENHGYGCAVVYANDVRKFRTFAQSLISKRSLFRAVQLRQRGRKVRTPNLQLEQYNLPFG